MTKKGMAILAALLSTAAASPALAGTVLIVNGATGTSESDTTASITTQISNLHTAAGNTVTVVDALPANLAGYQQVWDLRFSNNQAITAAQQSQYLSYLQGGGGMFVMGENAGFPTRNNSILSLIGAAGGGSLSFQTPGDAQIVYAPFTGPNPVTNISYSVAGGVNGFGTGQWITSNAAGTAGSGVAFAVGTLANARAGALTTIFDVNFLETDANAQSQALTRNLIKFVGGQVSPVPEPATWAMMILGVGMVGASMRRRQRVSVRYAI